jgi:hypothetical protein
MSHFSVVEVPVTEKQFVSAVEQLGIDLSEYTITRVGVEDQSLEIVSAGLREILRVADCDSHRVSFAVDSNGGIVEHYYAGDGSESLSACLSQRVQHILARQLAEDAGEQFSNATVNVSVNGVPVTVGVKG